MTGPFKCCVHCDDAKSDHVEHGGSIERDQHEVDCSSCEFEQRIQPRIRAAVAAALTEAADAIKSTSTDPDRRRPRATNAEVSTDFANDLQWAEQIVRDHIPKATR